MIEKTAVFELAIISKTAIDFMHAKVAQIEDLIDLIKIPSDEKNIDFFL